MRWSTLITGLLVLVSQPNVRRCPLNRVQESNRKNLDPSNLPLENPSLGAVQVGSPKRRRHCESHGPGLQSTILDFYGSRPVQSQSARSPNSGGSQIFAESQTVQRLENKFSGFFARSWFLVAQKSLSKPWYSKPGKGEMKSYGIAVVKVRQSDVQNLKIRLRVSVAHHGRITEVSIKVCIPATLKRCWKICCTSVSPSFQKKRSRPFDHNWQNNIRISFCSSYWTRRTLVCLTGCEQCNSHCTVYTLQHFR